MENREKISILFASVEKNHGNQSDLSNLASGGKKRKKTWQHNPYPKGIDVLGKREIADMDWTL
jgi:hypothetical protein